MKKFCITLIIVMLFSFVGCNQSKKNTSSETKGEKDNISSLASSNTTSIPVSAEMSNSNKTDLVDSVIASTINNKFTEDFSSIANSAYSSDSGGVSSASNVYSSDLPRAKAFGCVVEAGGTIKTFIDWCKESRVNDDFYDEYFDDSNLIDYLRNHDKIVIPTIRNSEYKFSLAKTLTNRNKRVGYKMVFASDTNPHLHITFLPVFNNTKLSQNQLLENFVDNSEMKINRSSKESIFGKYYETSSDAEIGAIFAVDGSIVIARYSNQDGKITEFDPKYFEYFDFETVSLK